MRDLGQVLAHVHDAEIEIIEGHGPSRGEHSNGRGRSTSWSAAPAVVSAPSPPIAAAQLLSADLMWLAAITVAAIAGTDLREGFGPLFCETLAL
jgi:hypothetical protein